MAQPLTDTIERPRANIRLNRSQGTERGNRCDMNFVDNAMLQCTQCEASVTIQPDTKLGSNTTDGREHGQRTTIYFGLLNQLWIAFELQHFARVLDIVDSEQIERFVAKSIQKLS